MRSKVEESTIKALKEERADFIVTLPEDPTANLSKRISEDPYFTYTGVINEGHGVAITAGGALAGRKSVFITGIAGLLVAGWALSMMGMLYRVPFVLLVSYRGDIGDKSGIPGPYLHIFGAIGEPLLRTLQIPYRIVSEERKIGSALHDAFLTAIENKTPVALLLTEEVLW